MTPDFLGRVDCVVTSPPYFDVTNYEEDQWLRLWYLGDKDRPTRDVYSRDDRHEREDYYWAFLCDAWKGLHPLLTERSHFVCRLGGKRLSVAGITTALNASMQFLARKWKLAYSEVSAFKRRQTDVFHPGTVGCRFEVNFHFRLQQ
jgi:hypothetical protein